MQQNKFPHILQINMYFSNKKYPRVVYNTIKDLVFDRERSATKINIKNNNLMIKTRAKDATALRASINSTLKGAILAEDILKI